MNRFTGYCFSSASYLSLLPVRRVFSMTSSRGFHSSTEAAPDNTNHCQRVKEALSVGAKNAVNSVSQVDVISAIR